MDLFAVTFQSVIVLLGIGVVGFLIVRRKVVSENALGTLSNLALDIALPCLIFVNILSTFSPADNPEWWMLPLWWLLFTGIAFALTMVFMFLSHQKTRREFAMSLFFHNGLFFPLAILTGMFGSSSPYLVSLFLFMLLYPAFLFNTYPFFFGKPKGVNWKRLFNTVFVATLIALALRFVGAQSYVPEFVLMILGMLGAMTVPVLMIVIGGHLAVDFQKKGKLYTGEILKFVLIKNIAFPFIFLGILLVLRPSSEIALLLLLQSAVPPVTAVTIFTERVGGNQSIVNQFLVASFIASLLPIPVMMSLYTLFFTL